MKRPLQRLVVATTGRADEVIDTVAYRPAVVKATALLPRWWQCDLARLSRALDVRWSVGWWDDVLAEPNDMCEACGRRTAVFLLGGRGGPGPLAERELHLCGWCRVSGPLRTEDELTAALRHARARSVRWPWQAAANERG